MKQKIQLIEGEVAEAGNRITLSEELDRSYKYLTGISILSNIGEKHLLSSSSVDGKELFPKNFEVKFLQSDISVAPNERFFTLKDREASGRRIEIDFQDVNGISYPYTVKIYLRLSNEAAN